LKVLRTSNGVKLMLAILAFLESQDLKALNFYPMCDPTCTYFFSPYNLLKQFDWGYILAL